MKFEYSTYQKPLTMNGFGGGAASLSVAQKGVALGTPIVYYDFGDTNCYNGGNTVTNLGSGRNAYFTTGLTYAPSQTTSSSGSGGYITCNGNQSLYYVSGTSAYSGRTNVYETLTAGDPWTWEYWYRAFPQTTNSHNTNYYHPSGQQNSAYRGTQYLHQTQGGNGTITTYVDGQSYNTYFWVNNFANSMWDLSINATNGWKHLVLTKEQGYTSNNFKIYLNNVNVVTDTSSWSSWMGSVGYPESVWFDSSHGAPNAFMYNGYCAIIKFYKVHFDANTVATEWNANKALFNL